MPRCVASCRNTDPRAGRPTPACPTPTCPTPACPTPTCPPGRSVAGRSVAASSSGSERWRLDADRARADRQPLFGSRRRQTRSWQAPGLRGAPARAGAGRPRRIRAAVRSLGRPRGGPRGPRRDAHRRQARPEPLARARPGAPRPLGRPRRAARSAPVRHRSERGWRRGGGRASPLSRRVPWHLLVQARIGHEPPGACRSRPRAAVRRRVSGAPRPARTSVQRGPGGPRHPPPAELACGRAAFGPPQRQGDPLVREPSPGHPPPFARDGARSPPHRSRTGFRVGGPGRNGRAASGREGMGEAGRVMPGAGRMTGRGGDGRASPAPCGRARPPRASHPERPTATGPVARSVAGERRRTRARRRGRQRAAAPSAASASR